MKGSVNKNLSLFFGLTFLISWGIWIPLALTDRSTQLLLWMAGFGPTLAAIIVTGLQSGCKGLRSLFVIRWQVNPLWYLISLLGTPLVMLAALGLHVALDGAWPQLLDPNHLVTTVAQWPLVIVVFLYIFIFTALGEEFGWRGYALSRLQTQFSPFYASLILGVIWSFWHLPLFWMAGDFHQELPLSWFLLQVLCSTFLYTWMYNRTRGSLLIMLLFHTASNAAMGLLPILPLDNGGRMRPLWLVVALLLFVLVPALWFNRRVFFKNPEAVHHD